MLFTALGPGDDLANAVRGSPGELALLERASEATPAPGAGDDGQAVLGGPGLSCRISPE